MAKIPTHDPQTGELNPYYKELTGKRNPLLPEEEMVIPTFDMKSLVGKEFRYKGKYGLSIWTDKVKEIRPHHSVQFEVPIKFGPPKENGLLNPLTSKIIGMKYKFFVANNSWE